MSGNEAGMMAPLSKCGLCSSSSEAVRVIEDAEERETFQFLIVKGFEDAICVCVKCCKKMDGGDAIQRRIRNKEDNKGNKKEIEKVREKRGKKSRAFK
jgi:hypothetical protein